MHYNISNIANGSQPAATVLVCKSRCIARDGCGYFTYKDGICHLKEDMTDAARVVDPTAYSGICAPQVCTKRCKPRNPSWRDSYEVDGRCYCWFGKNSFDHNIATVQVPTPAGIRTVRQVCEQIRSVFGVGAEENRMYYNTVACGNGPFNDAGDEDFNACPGRVEFGKAGCHMLGAMWDLEGAYAEPELTTTSTTVTTTTATRSSSTTSTSTSTSPDAGQVDFALGVGNSEFGVAHDSAVSPVIVQSTTDHLADTSTSNVWKVAAIVSSIAVFTVAALVAVRKRKGALSIITNSPNTEAALIPTFSSTTTPSSAVSTRQQHGVPKADIVNEGCEPPSLVKFISPRKLAVPVERPNSEYVYSK